MTMKAKMIKPTFDSIYNNNYNILYDNLESMITLEDIIQILETDTGIDEQLIFAYNNETGEELTTEDVNDNMFISFCRSYFIDNAFEFIDKIIRLKDAYHLTVYRALTVSDKWLEKLPNNDKPFGIWWAYDKNMAQPHWGYNAPNKQNEIRVETNVNLDDVNWKPTIMANAHPFYMEEAEIQLYPGTEFQITNIYDVDNKPINISDKIKNKIFKA